MRELRGKLALANAEISELKTRDRGTGIPNFDTVRIGENESKDGYNSENATVSVDRDRSESKGPPILLRDHGSREARTSFHQENTYGGPQPYANVATPQTYQPSVGLTAASSSAVGAQRTEVLSDYRAGLGFLQKRSFRAASQAFARFASQHPQHPKAMRARYWQAEAEYAARNYRKALQSFEQLLQNVPRAGFASEAMLKVGYCHLRLGAENKAKRHFHTVIKRYPESPAAQAARTEINNR